MKTVKIFSATGLAMIFSATLFASTGNVGTKGDLISTNRMVKHHVNVTLSTDKSICNTYLVEILNWKGEMVAPAQVYNPGVSQYDFYEKGPFDGIRIAVLVLAPNSGHFACETELFTAPVVLKSTFLPGGTYRYDLFPQTQAIKE